MWLKLIEGQAHIDTFVGRIEKGFDFLGYQITSAGLAGVARRTAEKFVERITQLYEQGVDTVRIGNYVRRWLAWFFSGLSVRQPPPLVSEGFPHAIPRFTCSVVASQSKISPSLWADATV